MVDTLGYRMKFGVIAPSTNTSVEPEFAWMQPDGVTNHFSRIETPDMAVTDDESFGELVRIISENTLAAIDSVKTCDPGYVVMGMSAETFWDGTGRADRLQKEFEERAGTGVSMGSQACQAALEAYSEEKPIKTIACLTPYMPLGDSMVKTFFSELGYDVLKVIGLKSASPMLIAHESEDKMRKAIMELNELNPDAIVQCGTNLACVRVAAEAEKWLNKPVIAINAATYWHALRANNINDKMQGFGRLLSDW